MAFGNRLSLGDSLSREMQFHFDEVEECCLMLCMADFRILACMWLGFPKTGAVRRPLEWPTAGRQQAGGVLVWLRWFV